MSSPDLPSGTMGILSQSPMTRHQVIVILTTVLFATLDGYDLLAMAYAAPALSAAWSLDRTTLGLLLAVSLVGMAFGSLVLSPIADITGRKPAVLGALSLMVLGSFLSAASQTTEQLAVFRTITGVGIGVMVALTTTLAAEFATADRRALAIAAISIGLPAGSLIGGVTAALLLQHFTWHAVFLSGAAAGTLLIPIAIWVLPESPAYLIARQPKNALARLNRVLERLGRATLAELPPPPDLQRASYRALFGPTLRRFSISFAVVQMCVSATAFYMVSWLPQMVKDMGFAASLGSVASATWSIVAIAAGLLFGSIPVRFNLARIASGAMIGFGLTVAAFGLVPPILSLVLACAATCGFFLGGATGIFYATVAGSLPPLSRVSGVGFVMGAGRVVSFAGPSLAGWMFAQGAERYQVSLIFAAAPIVAGLVLWNVRLRPTAITS